MLTYNQILVVIVPQDIKDELVDTLMGLDFISGFSLNEMKGYSKENSHYNINEQVEGYRQFIRFEVLHKEVEEKRIIEALSKPCRAAKARYWILPVVSAGHF